MRCRLKLDGRITTANFCKGDLSIIATRYVSSNSTAYLELFKPTLEEEESGILEYSQIFSKQVGEPVSKVITFSQSSSPSEGFFFASTNGGLSYCTFDESSFREVSHCENAHEGTIVALDYCSKDKLLFSGGYDGALKVWDVRCFGKKSEPLRFVPISSDRCCCIAHDGTSDLHKVFVGTQNGYVCLYDTRVNRDDAIEKFSFDDSISNMLAVASSTLIVSTFSQVYKVNFLLARNTLLYEDSNTCIVGISANPFECSEFLIANRTRRLIVVNFKNGLVKNNVVCKGESYWSKVGWHSSLPVYSAISYKSLEVGLFPPDSV
ncbi:uncharacterized protein Gasu_05590 [Galdieria sulphuraria]|uniref:Uncharacterized protein n=1 Tax=Galdieria sulphuraria TaxID=130081 RepID=M2Y8H1_GALSU|nr:uncharacterized protein Gasu_05590 [Galdieria sulphuraria]EME32144.1 hypothetical protein Gasu_05590 [Galdieria sulphuraria]|eukprot:XP_005708664.1 hypothetical protein Gasu_05590 [Galdieria sulphuraria]